MRRTGILLPALALVLAPAVLSLGLAPVFADAEPALTWHHEGFAALRKAAGEAKANGKRLLLGLSGSPT
jgi:hypothetical protein